MVRRTVIRLRYRIGHALAVAGLRIAGAHLPAPATRPGMTVPRVPTVTILPIGRN